MAKTIKDWIETEVHKVENRSVKFLSELYFHRVEIRPQIIDSQYMFSPADGVVIGAQERVKAKDSIIDVKGIHYSVQDLMDDDTLEGEYLVISIFMSFYHQHQNYIPFAGMRTYYETPPLKTFNKPMLEVEKGLMEGILNPEFREPYLRINAREISKIFAPKLEQDYYIVRVADYDVDSLVNWRQPVGEETQSYLQNDRFGMITYGSESILIVEQFEDGCKFKLRPEAQLGMCVKCRKDPLVIIEYPE